MTIRTAVKNYFWELAVTGRKTFRLSDLTAYVRGVSAESYSPESAGRILRKLRSEGVVNYTVNGNGEDYTVAA